MRQFIKFAVVGGIGTVINLAVLYTLTEYAGMFYLYSATAAFVVAVINNFVLNTVWTFGHALGENTAGKFAKFAAVSLASLAVNLCVLWFFTELAGIYYLVSQVLAIGVALIINFFGNKLWTFRNRTQTSL